MGLEVEVDDAAALWPGDVIRPALLGSDLVFTIFGSGCGSLFTYPAGDITIQDIAEFTHMMQIEKGVPTGDLNPIRTHIDRFKGGRITRLFSPAKMVHMVTADPAKQTTPVLRLSYFDMLKKNNFFPTIATPYTYQYCIDVIKKWDAWERTPESIKKIHKSSIDGHMNL